MRMCLFKWLTTWQRSCTQSASRNWEKVWERQREEDQRCDLGMARYTLTDGMADIVNDELLCYSPIPNILDYFVPVKWRRWGRMHVWNAVYLFTVLWRIYTQHTNTENVEMKSKWNETWLWHNDLNKEYERSEAWWNLQNTCVIEALGKLSSALRCAARNGKHAFKGGLLCLMLHCNFVSYVSLPLYFS